MSAFFDAATIEHLKSSDPRVSLLVEFEFKPETMRVWQGDTDLITNDGRVWSPLYGAGTIEGIGVTGSATSAAATFAIDASVEEHLALALEDTTAVLDQMVRVYVQVFDGDWQPAGAPILIWLGFMQPPEVTRVPMSEFDGATLSIKLTAENPFFNRSKAPAGRYTDRDQQRRSPGDRFFQHVQGMRMKQVVWPDYAE